MINQKIIQSGAYSSQKKNILHDGFNLSADSVYITGDRVIALKSTYNAPEVIIEADDILFVDSSVLGTFKIIGSFDGTIFNIYCFSVRNSVFNGDIIISSKKKHRLQKIYILDNCTIKGNIIFEKHPGIVYKKASAQINGDIINGQLMQLSNL